MNYIHCNENAIYYECGYSNDNAIYLALGSESYLFTDNRYALDATNALQKHSPKTKLIIDSNLSRKVANIIAQHNIKRVSFDPIEWRYYSIAQMQDNTKAKWIQKHNLSIKKRIIKKPKEIKLLQKSAKLGAKMFNQFAKMIEKDGFGKSEKELFYMAQSAMSRYGKNKLSFDPIVAIGINAAKPHAYPTKKKLKHNDLLLFDSGVKYKRYCSDRTRTVKVENGFKFDYAQKFSSKKLQKAYDAVLKAHDKTISKARTGMKASQIDKICRNVIEKAGFGEYFVHSTGHGVGLDIHEFPIISSRSKVYIENSMVYTIEPGIYIPNEFGIRIEDMVIMENGRARVLAKG